MQKLNRHNVKNLELIYDFNIYILQLGFHSIQRLNFFKIESDSLPKEMKLK